MVPTAAASFLYSPFEPVSTEGLTVCLSASKMLPAGLVDIVKLEQEQTGESMPPPSLQGQGGALDEGAFISAFYRVLVGIGTLSTPA